MEPLPSQTELSSEISSDKPKASIKFQIRPFFFTIAIVLIAIFILFLIVLELINIKKPIKQAVIKQTTINEKLSITPTKTKTYMTIGNFMINTKSMTCKISGEFRASLTSYTKFTKEDKFFNSLGPTLETFVYSKDKVIDANEYCSPIEIISKFTEDDLINKKIDSLTFFSSNDHIVWTKEKSLLDLKNKIIKTKAKQAKYFAVMAEPLDMISPDADIEINASKAGDLIYYPPVILKIISEDNKGGTGIDHTYFKLDNKDWMTYKEQIKITKPGKHNIEYYPVDKSENIGVNKKYEFNIIE